MELKYLEEIQHLNDINLAQIIKPNQGLYNFHDGLWGKMRIFEDIISFETNLSYSVFSKIVYLNIHLTKFDL